MLPLAILPIAAKVLKSPIAKNIGGWVGRGFKKKNKGTKNDPSRGNLNAVLSSGLATTAAIQPIQALGAGVLPEPKDKDNQGLPDKIGDILDRVTKKSRQVEVTTAVDNKTLYIAAGAAVLVAIILVTRK